MLLHYRHALLSMSPDPETKGGGRLCMSLEVALVLDKPVLVVKQLSNLGHRFGEVPGSLLRASFKGDIDIGIDTNVDVDIELDVGGLSKST